MAYFQPTIRWFCYFLIFYNQSFYWNSILSDIVLLLIFKLVWNQRRKAKIKKAKRVRMPNQKRKMERNHKNLLQNLKEKMDPKVKKKALLKLPLKNKRNQRKLQMGKVKFLLFHKAQYLQRTFFLKKRLRTS